MTQAGFKNRYLSVSRLRRFERCPLAFKLHYVDQLESEPMQALRFGTLLHAVLERLYQWALAEKHTGPIPDELALDVYSDEFIRSGLWGFALYDEGLRILRSYLRDNPMVDHASVLAVEQDFELDVGGFLVVGKIDRVDRVDADTVEVIDYKTNRAIYTREELDSDLQLTVYAMAARQLWPWAKEVRLGFYLLRHGLRMMTERSEEQLEAARGYIATLGHQTENAVDYPARLQANCAYCDHGQQCSTYQEALAGRVEVVKAAGDDLDALAREREQVASLARILYRRKEQLDGILKARLDHEGELELGGMRYSVRPVASHVTYPIASTLRALTEMAGMSEAELRDELLVIDKAQVDALVKRLRKAMPRAKHRLLQATLDAVAEKQFSARLFAQEVR
jgi:putative RecB family exonuclease